MTGGESAYDLEPLMRAAAPVRCKTGLAIARGQNRRKVVHYVKWIDAACTEGRLRYFAGWTCGDRCWDAIIVADPALFNGMCKRCESIAAGPFVYRFYDASDQLLYIGSATCRLSRMQDHERSSPWWPDVARTVLTDQPDIETARRSEALAIEAEAPLHNKRHNRQRGRWVDSQWQPAERAA